METKFTREFSLETRKADAAQRICPVVVSTTHPVDRGDFTEVLAHTPESIDLSRQPLPLIESHDTGKVNIGLVEDLHLDGDKLRGRVRLGKSQRALELWPDIESGIVRSVSVGYRVNSWEDRTDEVPPIMTAQSWTPHEVSIVSAPADPQAGLYRSLKMESPQLATTTEAEFITRERTRRTEIRRRCDPFMDRDPQIRTIVLECLDDPACTPEAASDRLLRALGEGVSPTARPLSDEARIASTRIYTRNGGDDFRHAAVDAILVKAGVKVTDPHPATRDLASMSMVEMVRNVMSQQGLNPGGLSKPDLFKRGISHTSSHFPLILADAMNKSLRLASEQAVASYRDWVSLDTTPDFKTINRPNLGAAPDLDLVLEGAQYEYGDIGEEAETFTIAKYGKIFGITREALINDDLSAFARIPQMFVAAAIRKKCSLVYGVLNTNGNMSDGTALFHADHSNLAGTPATLSVASLDAAFAEMRMQTAVGGTGYCLPQPRYLLVPPALEATARTLVSAMQLDQAGTSGTVTTGSVNRYGDLLPIVEPVLQESSSTAWYLAANNLDTISLAYLDGTSEGVSLDQEDTFNVDGTAYKVRLEAGAAAIDWRGLYKNAGA